MQITIFTILDLKNIQPAHCVAEFLGHTGCQGHRYLFPLKLKDCETIARFDGNSTGCLRPIAVFLNCFGQALATIINILDPHVVVIGGGLSHIDALYSRGREAAAQYVFNDEFSTPIVSNMNGDSAGVRGAAQLWPA